MVHKKKFFEKFLSGTIMCTVGNWSLGLSSCKPYSFPESNITGLPKSTWHCPCTNSGTILNMWILTNRQNQQNGIVEILLIRLQMDRTEYLRRKGIIATVILTSFTVLTALN